VGAAVPGIASAATTTVLVGPATVRADRSENDGPSWDQEVIAAALATIDDEVALLDEQPVAVVDLWRKLFADIVESDAAVLVYPSWWSSRRVATVSDAVRAVISEAAVLSRSAILSSTVRPRPSAVVEIADAFIAISRSSDRRPCGVVRRDREPTLVVEAVVEEVSRLTCDGGPVLVDCPDYVDGAGELSTLIVERLRAGRVPVTVVDDRRLLDVSTASSSAITERRPDICPSRRPRLTRASKLAVGIAAAAAVVAGATLSRAPTPSPPLTILVEGRVAVKVPVGWSVQRITAGPGSARVRVTSPSDHHAALHITQSPVPGDENLAHTAETLHNAMLEEPPGVFVEFNPDDRRAGRAAVTYREIRDGHDIRWVVLLDGPVRISIGCQSAPGREDAVRFACEQATASAREIGKLAGTVGPQR
jgi:type VII secretion-associated protein (TIGR03931 family)